MTAVLVGNVWPANASSRQLKGDAAAVQRKADARMWTCTGLSARRGCRTTASRVKRLAGRPGPWRVGRAVAAGAGRRR